MNRFLYTLAALLLCVPLWAQARGETASHMYDALRGQHLRYASVGACVVNVATGEVTASYNDGQAFVPASLTKLVTAATVLRLYPDTLRLHTRVGYDGYVDASGTLHGDIVIEGGLDPSLAGKRDERQPEAFLDSILAAVRRAGIVAVTGNVVADASACEMAVTPQWLVEDIGWYYGAGCYGINYRDNSYDLFLTTGKAGTCPAITGTSVLVPGLRYHNHLVAGDKDSSFVTVAAYGSECFLSGVVPARRDKFVLPCALPDPPLMLASEVLQRLQTAHVAVGGQATTDRLLREARQPLPYAATCLCDYPSAPLAQLVEDMLWHSDNLYAEALLRKVSLSCSAVASVSAGLAVEQRMWQDEGIDMDAIRLYDGCGLARKNAFTPRALATLLARAHVLPREGKKLAQLLPRAGSEGTVRSFMSRHTLPGVLRLKSGSMGGVLCYAGYYTVGNDTYAVVMMCNHHTCANSQVRRAFEQFLAAVF